MRILYRLCLLIAALALVSLGGSRHVPAQDTLGLGELEVIAYAGYGGFALPVANSALARQWAANGGLAWQIGMNYATIPVFVDILHRQPMARTARISVLSEHGYAAEELQQYGRDLNADDLSSPEVVVSREVLLPPSVPVSIALLPRTCPPSRPGSLQRLTVEVEAEGLQQPFKTAVEVIQLEPAHLYSLYLDGPPGEFYQDFVNEGNHLNLQIPLSAPDAPQHNAAEMLSSHLYTIGIARHEMTLAPLAARDFAFVVASVDQVRDWPQEDQQALLAFMLGGGRLCLFNAAGQWQGLDIGRAALPVGRGYLVPVSGGFDAARPAMVAWIEGELSEFTLWCRGTVNGWQSQILGAAGDVSLQLDLAALLGVAGDADVIASHRPGFMHPLWVYREACFHGALEPWTYPEFTTPDLAVIANNSNLNGLADQAASSADQSAGEAPLPFMLCVGEARQWPVALGWIALALPLVTMLGGFRWRAQAVVPALALVVLAGSALAWWYAEPVRPPPLRALLLDVDQHAPLAVIRELAAARTGQTGDTELALAAGSFVRRVSSHAPGPWTVTSSGKAWVWEGNSTSDTLSVMAETYAASPELPVKVNSMRVSDRELALTVDTSGLSSDAECYLLTALGWMVVPGKQPSCTINLELPSIPEWPGLERFQAWEERLSLWLPSRNRFGVITDWRTQALLRHLQRRYGENHSDAAADAAHLGASDQSSARMLTWLALGQNPTTQRGLLHSQGILFAPVDPASIVAGESGQTLAYLRLTFSLEGAP